MIIPLSVVSFVRCTKNPSCEMNKKFAGLSLNKPNKGY